MATNCLVLHSKLSAGTKATTALYRYGKNANIFSQSISLVVGASQTSMYERWVMVVVSCRRALSTVARAQHYKYRC
jgi:hypothetical protein